MRRRTRLLLGVIVVCGMAGAAWLRLGPLPAELLDDPSRPSTLVLDRRGEVLYESRSAIGLRGEWIDDAAIPAGLAAATIAAEDVRFRWHPGLDPIAIVRAAWRDLRTRRLAEGGSTITQQVAKLLLARQHNGRVARGWRAKLYEALVALRLEHRLSKARILGLYVNLSPYGNQIQGAGRAARAYFGRGIASLTPAETAFLAALPQQPSRFNPWRTPERAVPRQQRILNVMHARGWIGDADVSVARAERLTLTRGSATLAAPHAVARVLAATRDQHPRRIQTTLDATLQRTIEGIIAAQRSALTDHHASNVAVAVLDNRSGEWLAWEGSGDYFDAEHGGTIDGVVTPRQPGSALKPFTYAAAFERGITPGQALPDVPSQFPTALPGVLYSPRNYDGHFRGPLLARAALAGSENVPAVALAAEIGVPAVARLLRRAGFSTLDNNADHYGLGLTLGNAEVRLDELVAGYAMFARGGERLTPRLIRAIDGTPVPDGPTERIVSARTAFWIADILSDNEARAYVFGRGGSLEFPFPVAAKTGTSQSYFDNWAVGYTRDVTVGVWVGNFDRTPLRGSSGVTGAGPLFHAVMLAAVEHARGSLPIDSPDPVLAPPADVQRLEICATSGMPAGPACPTRANEWLPEGTEGPTCTWHHASDEGPVTIWPAVYRTWARDHGLLTQPFDVATSRLASSVSEPVSNARVPASSVGESASSVSGSVLRRRGRSAAARDAGLAIARPLAGALFLIDPTLHSDFQTIPLVAEGGAPGPLDWFVDAALFGTDHRGLPLRWPLARGRHIITVRDAAGATARATVEVR